MIFLSVAAWVLYFAALLLTVLGTRIPGRLRLFHSLGGLCWAAGTIFALLHGTQGRVILLPTLLLLLAAGWKRKEETQ